MTPGAQTKRWGYDGSVSIQLHNGAHRLFFAKFKSSVTVLLLDGRAPADETRGISSPAWWIH
jgi:hypothetical protein